MHELLCNHVSRLSAQNVTKHGGRGTGRGEENRDRGGGVVSRICGISPSKLGSGNGARHSVELQRLQGEGGVVSQICGIPTSKLGSGNGERHSVELQRLQEEGGVVNHSNRDNIFADLTAMITNTTNLAKPVVQSACHSRINKICKTIRTCQPGGVASCFRHLATNAIWQHGDARNLAAGPRNQPGNLGSLRNLAGNTSS